MGGKMQRQRRIYRRKNVFLRIEFLYIPGGRKRDFYLQFRSFLIKQHKPVTTGFDQVPGTQRRRWTVRADCRRTMFRNGEFLFIEMEQSSAQRGERCLRLCR